MHELTFSVPKITRILAKIYSAFTAQTKLDKKGRSFEIKRGVRQGDPFSSNIFNAVLEDVFAKLNWKGKGISIKTRGQNLGKYIWLNNLRFADDVVLVVKNSKELREMAEDLVRASAEVGLSINKAKTNISTNIENLEEIYLDEEKIVRVEEYKYLGQAVSFSDRTKKELKVRRANSWKAFWAKKAFWRSKLKLKTKIRILESSVMPVLTYGAQTWAITQQQIEKLQTTQNAMIWSILRIKVKDKVRLEQLYTKTKAKPVGVATKLLKYRYAGHTMRDLKHKWN